MGRVFCLPVFSRRNKLKVEYLDEEEVKSASRTTSLDNHSELLHANDKVETSEGSASHTEVKSENTEQLHNFSEQDEKQAEFLALNKEELIKQEKIEEQERAADILGQICDHIQVDTPALPISLALIEQEALENEVLTGHLSDPGLYCAEDHEFSDSCQSIDCGQNNHGETVNFQDVTREDCKEMEDCPEDIVTNSYDDDDGGYSGLKRVEEWVRSIENLSQPFIEMPSGESSSTPPATRTNGNYKEIEHANGALRSLDPHASVAHLSGMGLTVISCLSTFVHLKTLKLSANSIVRITPGSLPKGLHTLDLSRNKITVIEGLRELTRLRSLNLSYNRISRIGQGLANCSSIRELYLACNKISEVEGLHRLTKLAFLDLSFNRLSSTKSLGQIAATYTSLMAVNLIGNPVIVNIGEEQLKRFMNSVAPNLVYLNNQPVKSGTSSRDPIARSLMASSASRHSPHNLPNSKGKRISSNRKEPLRGGYQQFRNNNVDVRGQLIGRLQGMQRVKSDGALNGRDLQ